MNDLEQRARELFPKNEEYQKRWMEAVMWLRSQNRWIADTGSKAPAWGIGVDRIAA